MVVVVIVVVKFKQESELCFGCCSLALVFCLLLTWFGFSPSLVYFFYSYWLGDRSGSWTAKICCGFFQKFLMGNVAQTE